MNQNVTSLTGLDPAQSPQILIVDDSGVNRDVVKIFLEHQFPTPYSATNGQEALDILKTYAVDIILMDIHMPIMNGLQATKVIRESELPLANTKIIAITGDDRFHNREICKRYLFDDVIAKPIRQDDLVKLLLKTASEIAQPEERKLA